WFDGGDEVMEMRGVDVADEVMIMVLGWWRRVVASGVVDLLDRKIDRGENVDADQHLAWLINTHIGCDESAGAGFKTEILLILAGQVTTLAAMAKNNVIDRGDGVAPDEPIDPTVLTRLTQFSAVNKLKKIASKVIASNLAEEIVGLTKMFNMVDINNNGCIAFKKLKDGLKNLVLTLMNPAFVI
nr:calcium-dependent protein kinase 26-like [Tanacetum cinerariifolium]